MTYSAKQIACYFKKDVYVIRMRALRESWPRLEVRGNGGVRYEYRLEDLPEDVQEAIRAARARQIGGGTQDVYRELLPAGDVGAVGALRVVPALPAVGGNKTAVTKSAAETATAGAAPAVNPATQAEPVPLAAMTKRQRDEAAGRAALLAYVDELAAASTVTAALERVAREFAECALPEHLAHLPGVRRVSPRTLARWMSRRASGALVARTPRRKKELPEWAPMFLRHFRRSSSPSIPQALESMARELPPGAHLPSMSSCLRLRRKIGLVEWNKGRKSGSELKALKPMRRRKTDHLLPMQVLTCDGHTYKAKVANPMSGKPFQPEVCLVLDVATRRCVGWSAGLAESADTVADALGSAVRAHGLPLIVYTDNGAGNTAKVNADAVRGRFARLDIEFHTGIPGNPQGRGLVERAQGSLWVASAKELPTYCGEDMDGLALRKVSAQVEKDMREMGASPLLPTWPEFLSHCAAAVARYNARPHGGLVALAKRAGVRELSPEQAWAWHLSQGWEPDALPPEELEALWRPRREATLTRGEIRMWKNIYFAKELSGLDLRKVQVEYDPRDASRVWVRDLEGRLLGEAKWRGNESSYFPVSEIQALAERRAKGRLLRLERQAADVRAELAGATVIDAQIDPEAEAARRLLEARMEAEALAPAVEEIPEDAAGRWRLWKELEAAITAGREVPEELVMFHRSYRATPDWRAFAAMERDFGIGADYLGAMEEPCEPLAWEERKMSCA